MSLKGHANFGALIYFGKRGAEYKEAWSEMSSVKSRSGVFNNFRFFGFDDLRNVALRVIFAGQPKHIEVAPEMLRFGFSINLDQKAEN